jgi:hypothetical protein
MKMFLKSIAAVMLFPLVSGANTFYQYDAITSIHIKPGNYASERMLNLAKFNHEIQSDAQNNIAVVNASVIFNNGYQISYPGKYFVEYDNAGKIKSYRYEYVEPVLNLLDPSFDPQNPSLLLDKKKIVIADIPRQKKVIITEGIDGKQEKIEDKIPLNSIDPGESWIDSLTHYKEFEEKGLQPKIVIGAIQSFEFENAAQKVITLKKEGKKVALSMDSEQDNSALSETFTLSDDGKCFTEFSRSMKDSVTSIILTNPKNLSEEEGRNHIAFPEN